jgi:spore coat assembly protein
MYEINDIVRYKIDGYIYHIRKICLPFYTLYGINNRKIIICKEEEIEKVPKEEIDYIYNKDENKKRKVINLFKIRKNNTALFGRILHIDGDEEFLNKCLSLYKELGIYAYGVSLNEKEIYMHIEKII